MNLESVLEKISAALIDYGPKVLAAVAVFVIGYVVAKVLLGVFRGTLRRAKVDPTLATFLANLVNMGLLALVAISALGKLGVPVASFAAMIAAAGLAVGLALQGSLGNFAAGVMLILFRPFDKGDFIEAAGISGTVQEVDVFATKLLTPDNKLVICGNSQISNGSITNYSAMDTRRVDMVFGIGYDDEIEKARLILKSIIENHPLVLKDPAWTIAVSELADSSVNFVVRPWTKTSDYWAVKFQVTEAVKNQFDAAGISIPYPQRDVHMHQVAS